MSEIDWWDTQAQRHMGAHLARVYGLEMQVSRTSAETIIEKLRTYATRWAKAMRERTERPCNEEQESEWKAHMRKADMEIKEALYAVDK